MGEFDERPCSRERGSALIQILAAIVLLAFVVGYVVPNVVRYPWHSIVLVVFLVGSRRPPAHGSGSSTGCESRGIPLRGAKGTDTIVVRRCLGASRLGGLPTAVGRSILPDIFSRRRKKFSELHGNSRHYRSLEIVSVPILGRRNCPDRRS